MQMNNEIPKVQVKDISGFVTFKKLKLMKEPMLTTLILNDNSIRAFFFWRSV